MAIYISEWFEKNLKKLMPQNNWGDRVVAFVNFYKCHGRMPKKQNGGFNDALYWLKTSGQLREPLRVQTTDKALAKDYIRRQAGDQYNVPTLAVLESIEEARTFPYPESCAIKPTHMSGKIILRKNGSPIDFEEIETWFITNYYCQSWGWREQNYKTLVPKVIVEPLIFGRDSVEDYKVFCVLGAPKVIQVDFDRYLNHTRCLYTLDWKMLPYGLCYPVGRGNEKPLNLDEMLTVATKLCAAFNLVRVDLYTNGQQLYVGELTHCHGNAQEYVLPADKEDDLAKVLFGPQGFDWRTLAEYRS